MVKLSIVIPYYKTYDLTIKLLDVLVKQLTDEVEVYLIDDGCDEKQLDKYETINIIHLKENRGNSHAINTGIKKAKGKYIAIIDSDDMIKENYVEELLKAIDNTDSELIMLDWVDMHTGEVVTRPSNPAPWRSVYRKDIIPLFRENIRHASDVPFREDLDEDHKTKYYIDKVLYIYNSNRVGSLTWELQQGDDS